MKNPFRRSGDATPPVGQEPASPVEDAGLSDRRLTMLVSLEGDLTAMGWDQPAKLFAIVPHDGEEFFELSNTIEGNVLEFLDDLSQNARPAEGVVGLVLATEGWAYPEDIKFGKDDQAVMQQYYKMMPPSEHPRRREVRSLSLMDRTGASLQVTRVRNGALDTDGVDVGGRLSLAMRQVLGLEDVSETEALARRVVLLEAMAEVTKGFQLARQNNWDAQKFLDYVREHVPAEIADTILNDPGMPDDIRKALGRPF